MEDKDEVRNLSNENDSIKAHVFKQKKNMASIRKEMFGVINSMSNNENVDAVINKVVFSSNN